MTKDNIECGFGEYSTSHKDFAKYMQTQYGIVSIDKP